MELLVVLAVIALLIGLLFPALMGARERAKVTRARGEVQTLQQAWLAYWNTYGKWPSSGPTEMDAAAVAILAGVDATDNPYKIAFMEFDERHLAEGFKDPWLENFYQIRLTAVDNADTQVDWQFTTRVHCINTGRYRY
jgi:type II secretory pathway pseudopilin PulG